MSSRDMICVEPGLCILDIGTSSVKAWIDGEVRIVRLVELDSGALDPGPIDSLIDLVDRRGYRVIITGQRASAMGWDEDRRSPIYTWRSDLGRDLLREVYSTGDPLASLFLRPASSAPRLKLLLDMGYRYVGGVETYVSWRLDRRYVVDYAYAHTYGLLDPFSKTYMEHLLSLLGMDGDSLPKPVDSYEEGGRVVLQIPDQSAAYYGEDPTLSYAKLTLGTGCFAGVYTGDSPMGDLEKGVVPMMLDGLGGFMAEAYLSSWGDLLDDFLAREGLGYDYLGEVDLGRRVFKIPGRLLSGSMPSRGVGDDNANIVDLVHSLVAGGSYVAGLIRSVKEFDRIYVGGGGALSRVVRQGLADVLGLEVVVRRSPRLSTIHGAYAYLLRRRGDDPVEYIEGARPVEEVLTPERDLSWMADTFGERLGS